MFDIGFGELMLAALVALLVLGPERLPGAARTVGALIRRMRESWGNVRDEVERELEADDLRRRLREVQSQARDAASTVRDQVRDAGNVMRRKVDMDAPAENAPAEDPQTDTEPDATGGSETCASDDASAQGPEVSSGPNAGSRKS